jgi:hypothetical protein
MINNTFEETLSIINEEIGNEEKHNQGWYDLNWFLSENLVENTKRKNLICRMSAMLEENYKTKDVTEIERICTNLFATAIDIEHIQSYHDSNGEKRQDIWDEWKDDINSLGNLMVLEQGINRSISNIPYEDKISRYTKSIYTIVRKQPIDYQEWDLSACLKRKEIEKKKILTYLFRNNEKNTNA